MRIVVFGAGGFVGGSVCEELATLKKFDVLACVRRWASATRLARRGLAIVQCDLDDVDGLAQAVKGADVVVNAAMPSPNVESELCFQLYSACMKYRVNKFIQFSSAAIYGNREGDINEGDPPAPDSTYSSGKVRMENALLRAAVAGVTQLFILRPSIIYGPFADAWSIRYAQRIAFGHWLSLGPAGSGICNLIHARDLARFVILVADLQAAEKTHVLNLNGPDIVSWNEYIERFGDALNIAGRAPQRYASFQFMALAMESIRIVGQWAKKRRPDLIQTVSDTSGAGHAIMERAKYLAKLYPSLDELRLLRRKAKYSANLAAATLNFIPAVGLDEGLQETAHWCKVHGVV